MGAQILDVHYRFEQRGAGLLHRFFEGERACDAERHIARVHVVVFAVVEGRAEIRDRESGEIAALGRFANAALDETESSSWGLHRQINRPQIRYPCRAEAAPS